MTKQTEGLLGGRYKILREIARGGFGITYLAQDTLASNIRCVIKKLNPQNADVEAAKRLFQREAHILNYLQQNQQIPKYFNYFEERNDYYIVQQYIEGQSLDKLIYQRWTTSDVIGFLREILLILKHLHEVNILHRDIKPSNIIQRDEDKKFVLIDFGSVKQIYPSYSLPSSQEQLPLHTMIGTPGYAPTEQMAGRPGFSCDIYALGMTAIQLLTGVHPRELRRDHNDNILFPIGVEIADSLSAILTKMVYSGPERRYQSVDEVIKDLNEVTVRQNGAFGNWNSNPAKTKINPPTQFQYNNQNSRTQLTVLRLPKKRWLIPIVLTTIGAIVFGVEFMNPFLRPLYYSYQGNLLLDAGKPEAALEQFENAKAVQPNYAPAWKGRGDALFSLGRDFGALSSYNKALSLQQNNLTILNNKGKLLYKLGRYQDALEIHEKVLEIDSNNADGWSGKGLAYIGLRKYEEASKSFEKLREINPDEPRIWYEIGLATEQLQGQQVARKFYEEAIKNYESYLRRKPGNPIAWTDQGTVLLKLGNPHDALASYEKALDIDNNFYEALLGRGNALLGLGRLEEAFSAFDKASDVRPQDYQVWYNRGVLLARHFKKHEEALDSFNKVIDRRSDFAPAWQDKGLVLSELNRNNEALVALNKAKDLAPKDPYVWANLGSTLEMLGRTQEAKAAYDKAIELGFPQPEQLMIKTD